VEKYSRYQIGTAYEKYRQYLHQYSKSIADTIGSNTNTATPQTLHMLPYNHANWPFKWHNFILSITVHFFHSITFTMCYSLPAVH